MTDLYNTKNSIIFIIIYICIFIFIIGFIFKKHLGTYIDENWRNNRCYPHIIPFAGFSKKAPGNSFIDKTTNNFNYCINNYFSSFLNILMKPLLVLLNGITGGISNIKSIIDKFRNMASVLRNMFASLVDNTVKRMENSYAAVIYLQEKMKVLIKKQSAVFEVLKHFLGALPMLFYSFSYGPIPRFAGWLTSYLGILIAIIIVCVLCIFGGPFVKIASCPICVLCFEEDTLIDMNDDNKKAINQLEINDKIKGGTVEGILKITLNHWKLYNYNGIIVSGSHLVYHQDKWMRIEETDCAERIFKSCALRCLITNSHNIFIDGIKFRDYQETDDKDILQQINYAISKKCNKDTCYIRTKYDFEHLYQWGFHGDTLVKCSDKFLKIKDIVEKGLVDHNIIGHVKIKVTNEKFYNFNNIIVSGSTLYKNEVLWERIHQSKISELYESFDGYIYHLITIDNILIVSGNDKITYFRDFIENHDDDLNNKIDKLIEERLNLMSYI